MSAARPLALGLSLGGPRGPGEMAAALDQVEHADALGLHSVWLPEGHFSPGAMPSPLVVLAAFAARTRRVLLATTSLLLPVRPAHQVADEVATLDRLSGGRVWLGLGRGFRAPLFAAFGVSRADKRNRFDAALDAILERWAGAPPGSGPLQAPHPPLLVAAFGPKGLLQAARRGLPYLASPLETLDTLGENHRFHRDHLPDHVDPDALTVGAIRTVYAAEDDGDARRVRDALSQESRAMSRVLPPALARAAQGSVEERVIVGTPAEIEDRLGSYREAIGLDLLIARGSVPNTPEAQWRASLERLTGEILPRVNG